MKVMQITDNQHVDSNQFLFCIENQQGFTWLSQDGKVYNSPVSITTYAKDTESPIIGDFNE